jgi:hypothetical protein
MAHRSSGDLARKQKEAMNTKNILTSYVFLCYSHLMNQSSDSQSQSSYQSTVAKVPSAVTTAPTGLLCTISSVLQDYLASKLRVQGDYVLLRMQVAVGGDR